LENVFSFKKILIQNLGYGENNAIHCAALAKICTTDERTIQAVVLSSRIQGIPILSSDHGYFLPGPEEGHLECKRFIAAQTSRAKTSFASINAAKSFLEGAFIDGDV